MTSCWTPARWTVFKSHIRRPQVSRDKLPHIQRFASTEQSRRTEDSSKSLSENEFLDFVLGSHVDRSNTQLDTRQPSTAKQAIQEPASRANESANETPNAFVVSTDASAVDGQRARRRRSSPRKYVGITANEERTPQRSLTAYVRPLQSIPSNATNHPRRIRWLNLKHRIRPSADVSTAWTVNYARLTNKYDHLQASSPNAIQDVELDERASQWAEHLLEAIDKESSDRVGVLDLNQFQHQFGERGRGVWREVTLWLLAHRKDRVVDFLLATHVGPFYPPMNWISDTLYHMALYYTSSNTESRAEGISKLIKAFKILSERPSSGEQMEMQNGFIRRLLPFCSLGEVEELYDTLKRHKVQVNAGTLHHLSRYFAKQDRLEQGIEALLTARALGSNVNGYMFRSNCTTLLRASMRHPGGQRLGLRLVDNLLKMGVYLDKQLRGIVMLNAVDSGDFDTAMAVYESMVASGIRPDAQTYGILLKGCRSNLDDTATLTGLIDRAIKQSDVRQNPILSSQILHCLCLHHIKHENGFPTIKEAYAQLFQKSLLERLGIDMRTEHFSTADEADLLTPSGYDVAVMLSAYLRDASIFEAKRLYDTWRKLISSGDEHFVSLASKPFLANTFIYKFVSSKTTLLEATRVVKDMQTPLLLPNGEKQSSPDVYTWSILVHGFTRFNQPKHAERVLAKMQELGYRPNHVTWNTLLSGYTSSQDIEGTLDTLRRLEESDTPYNEWTYRGLSRLSERNRMKVRSQMDRRKYVRQIDFTSDLKTGISGKLAQLELKDEAHSQQRS